MLIGIMSDIHCNDAAMERAVQELSRSVDTMVVAGDAVFEYRFSNEVIERIRAHKMHYVVGNHELALLGPDGERARSAPWIRPENLEFMAAAPKRKELDACGKRIVIVHASPFAPYNDYLYPGTPQLARCAEVDADILVLGHTHVPMVDRVGRIMVVNPGSLGMGGDPSHPGLLSYAILDTDRDEVTIRRFTNPHPC